MGVFVDKLHLLQNELSRLRMARGEYVSGQRAIDAERDEGLSDVIAELDRQILDITLAIVKLGGPSN